MTLKTVKVPKEMEPLFAKAEEAVAAYFAARCDDPTKGTIEIADERYIMVRAASLSVEFFALVERLFGPGRERKAQDFARNLLFDLAHVIGKADARSFHAKMGLADPIARLSAGPVHFAHSGWAFVDIFPESRPSPDDEYYLLYDHPYAFEADAWLRSGRKADFPVCIMNAGYSSGWCEESFGVTLVASEILCRARGDDCCRFIMAPPARIAGRVEDYTKARPEFADKIQVSQIPDLFARKRAEEALRDSEARYRTIIEASADGILIADIETKKFTYANPTICRMLWYTQEEMMAMGVEDIHPKDSLPEVFAEFEAQVRGDRTLAPGLPCLRKDGTIFYADINTVKVTFHGKAYNLGFFRDVTARMRAEEALKRSETKYRTLVENLPQKIFVKDRDSAYVSCNENYAKDLGIKTDEILGKSDFEFYPQELAEKYRADDRRIMETGEVETIEEQYLEGGEQRWVRTTKLPVHDGGGKVVGIMGVFSDITERKHTEIRVAAVNECLLGLGADHEKNLNLITAAAGSILGADFALYHRITGNALHGAGAWNVPTGFQPKDLAKGHICTDIVSQGPPECVVIRDLPSTPYAETDPAVRAHGLKTYVGHAVRLNDKPVGSLCAVFTRDIDPDPDDLMTLGALAGALGVEEERHAAVERLQGKLREIEKLNTFMTDRERRIVEMKREVNAMLRERDKPARYGV